MATATLESAIPPHLREERSIPAKTPQNYQPPFPAYSARFPEVMKDLVMAIIGIQHKSKPSGSLLSQIQKFLETSPDPKTRPAYTELACVTDVSGYYNEVTISYWQTKSDFDSWAEQSGFQTWWNALDPSESQNGYFLEVFYPSVERFETIFSDNEVPEGAAYMRTGMTGEVKEHVYWGSMRDRLAAGQNDELRGEASFKGQASHGESVSDHGSLKKRIKIPGKQNLAMIRSGQDWSNTTPHERKLYLDTMHPVLIRGMDFLRDSGSEVGCFSCRFMECLDKKDPGLDASRTERTFGLAYFDDLASLEGWSKQHKTHLDIFGRFLQYAKELQNNVSLRLFHEVMVLKSDQQRFEYVGCHSKTGMLASMSLD